MKGRLIKTALTGLMCMVFSAAEAIDFCGRVVDGETGEPLLGVNVMIQGTVLGASTNHEGRFCIFSVPSGSHVIDVTMIGYVRKIVDNVRLPLEKPLTIALQSTVLKQPGLVITASKRKQLIEDSPVTVDVIDRRSIETRNVTSLDEVLQNTAGIGITAGQIDLRGSTGWNYSAGSRVLLMIDGHPVINGDTGGINWDLIPVDEVERVEVVKGAGSALYGSNAMAGMVNIITRDPAETPETHVKYSWGFYGEPAYDSWQWTDDYLTAQMKDGKFSPTDALAFSGADVSHSQKIGNVGLLVSAGTKTSTGYYENGNYDRYHFMGKLKYHFSSQKTFSLTGTHAMNDHGEFIMWQSQAEPLRVPVEDRENAVQYAKSSIRGTFKNAVNEQLAYTFKANFYRTDWENNFVVDPVDAMTDRVGSEIQVDYLLGSHALTFGSELTWHQTDSKFYGNRQTQDISFYAEDEVKWQALWTLTVGGRFDYHKVEGISEDRQFSPRLGLVWRAHEATSVRMSVGHGFRAPSIAEVFANTSVSGVRVVPNLDLNKAERAWSSEIGIRQILIRPRPVQDGLAENNPVTWILNQLTPQLIVDAAFFYSRYTDMIDVDFSSNLSDVAAVQFMNRGDARIAGLETQLTAVIFNGKVRCQTGYTYIDPVDLNTDEVLNYRSKHRFTVGLEWHSGRWRAGCDYRYASRIVNMLNLLGSGFEQRVPMHVADIRAAVTMGRFEAGVEIKNFRNYHYILRQRFLEPNRHYVMTLRGHF